MVGRWCESEELRGEIGGNMTEIHCMNFSKNEHIIRKKGVREGGSEGGPMEHWLAWLALTL